MASVYARNRRWYLRVKDPDGKWIHRASTARTKTEAKHLAWELERKYERARLGLDPLPQGPRVSVVPHGTELDALPVVTLSNLPCPTRSSAPESARQLDGFRPCPTGLEPARSWSRTARTQGPSHAVDVSTHVGTVLNGRSRFPIG